MNRSLSPLLILVLAAAPVLAATAKKAPKAAKPAKAAKTAKAAPKGAHDRFKNDDERALYAYGYQIGRNVATFGFGAAEIRILTEGLSDAALSKGAAVNTAMYLPRVSEMLEKRMEVKAAAEKKKGAAYAEKFAKEKGVLPIPNGHGWIQTERAGTGAQAKESDTVKVNYEGKLIDGTVFDSSYKRGEPATFPLRGVIPCWTDGVAMMKVGEKAKLVCPSDAAYGDHGHPPVIPGGSTLVFEVELLDIVKPDAAPAQ